MSDRTRLRGLASASYEDLIFLLCTDLVGTGISRSVYGYRPNNDWVIKVELDDGFQNVTEWQVWEEVQNVKALARWFAPCFHISGYGQWLIQARTFPLRQAQLPKRIPAIFTDLKVSNWGWYKGRAVCHDYGTILCKILGNATKRMQRADWWT